MVHVAHYKAHSVKRIANEFTRQKDKSGNLICNTSKDGHVDLSKIHLNYVLDDRFKYQMKSKSANTLTAVIKKRVNEVPHSTRKDLNVLSSWVVTAPEELATESEHRKFFEVVYSFVQKRYGDENVINGYVHMDEMGEGTGKAYRPHIHIPLVAVKDNRISAKAVFTKSELRNFHKDLDNICESEFGIKNLILNGRTKGKFTVAELKERDKEIAKVRLARQHATAIEQQNFELTKQHLRQRKELNELIEKTKSAIAEISKYRNDRRVEKIELQFEHIKEKAKDFQLSI